MVIVIIPCHKSSNELVGHHTGHRMVRIDTLRVKSIIHGQEYAYDDHHYLINHSEKGSLVIHYGHQKVSLWELQIRKIKCFKENQCTSMLHGGKYICN